MEGKGRMALKRFLCLLLCLFTLPARALEGDLTRLFRQADTMGACVALFQNGEMTRVFCYGKAAKGTPVQSDTLFQVGSISKTVAAMGLLQLLEEKGLSLEADIGDVLGFAVRHPDHPNEPVTLRQLLTHTAGLRDSAAYDAAIAGDALPLDRLLRQRSTWGNDAPGTQRVYSNMGGGVAGSLMETLSSQTVDECLQQRLFAPLGITAAYQPALLPKQKLANLYHMPQNRLAKALAAEDTVVSAPDPLLHYTYTAGKLTLSAPDLCRLCIALCDGGVWGDVRVLKESAVAEMLKPQNRQNSVLCDTHNGLFVNILTDVVPGAALYGHGGRANGMLCAAYFDPLTRRGAVMLTNGCKQGDVVNGLSTLSRKVLRACFEKGFEVETEDAFLVQPE